MSTQQKPCSHIKRLTKKTLNELIQYVQQLPNTCIGCNRNLMDISNKQNIINICLHCGSLLCFQCIQLHQKQTNLSHIFTCQITLAPDLENQSNRTIQQTAHIHCLQCNGKKIQKYPQNQQITDEAKQLNRFLGYMYKQIIPVLIKASQQARNNQTNITQIQADNNQQKQALVGLINLGNTCFMNVVIQLLYNVKQLRDYYLAVQWGTSKDTDNKSSISGKYSKVATKQQQYYYDESIEDFQQNSWHIVQKKTDSKKQNKYHLEKMYQSSNIKDSRFNQQFSKLMGVIFSSGLDWEIQSCVEPIEFLNQLGIINQQYLFQKQQDAEELLYLVLDVLSQGQLLKIHHHRQRYEKIEKILGRQKLTPTQKIFSSYFASHIVCESCKRESWTLDLTYGLSCPIFKSENKNNISKGSSQGKFLSNINEPIPNIKYYTQLYPPRNKEQKSIKMLEPLFKQQRLSYGNNYWVCEKCEGLSATKNLYLLEEPEFLIISFKRFDHRFMNTGMKINDYVQFEQIIDIASVCLRRQDEKQIQHKKYKLKGVIVHEGKQINTGHYYCYMNKGKADWYRFSDTSVRRVTWKQVRDSQAYILIYRKFGSNQKK